MTAPPSGTVTFLFTDIEGSTRRWDEQREAMPAALARHDAVLREAIERHGGYVFKTVGDAFHAAFDRSQDALAAAVEAQRTLDTHEWGGAVRMALHSGTADERDGDYFGLALNRVARLRDAGHGGQVLLSGVTAGLVRGQTPEGVELRDLGEHRLRDLAEPEHIYQAAVWGLPADFPPLRLADDYPTNLPTPLTSFVGRERETEDIVRSLERARLVTLTGPGGTGKTRLALAVAERVRDRYPDGVWFVDLSAIADAGLVASAIAQALGVRESEGRSLPDALTAYLTEKRTLLVLDNFEQVIDAAALVRALLAACPGLVVLVTSRVPLRLAGEKEYPVPPLPLPDEDARDGAGLAGVPSVALFVERAQDVKPEFALTPENAQAVADVCTRLDGLPLAIELAASRIRLLSPDAIRTRLDERLALLTGGPRDVPERQRTLRNTIRWSHDLLTPEQQTLFRRLGVFAGGCTLDAAAAVCDVEGDLSIDLLDGLTALVEQSLLRQQDDGAGDARFTMLATIREFALEQLAGSGEADATQGAHASYLLTLAGRRARPADGRRIAAELPNIRAVLEWCATAGAVDVGTHLLWALSRLGLAGIRFGNARESDLWTREARRWAERLLARPEAAAPSVSRGRLLFVAGMGAGAAWDVATLRATMDESLAVSRAVGDAACLADALRLLGYWHLTTRNPGAARPLLDESLALSRGLGDEGGMVWSLYNLGVAAVQRDEPGAARAHFDESLRLARTLGNALYAALPLSGHAILAARAGDPATGRRLSEEALSLQLAVGENGPSILAHIRLARRWSEAGDDGRARPLLAEGLALMQRLGAAPSVGTALALAGRLALAGGDAASAARLLGAAALQEASGEDILESSDDLIARSLAAVRAALDEDAFAAAYEEGRALSRDEAIALALAQTTTAGGGP